MPRRENAQFAQIIRTVSRVCESSTWLTPTAITFFNTFLSKLRTIIPIIVLFHKGIFYIYGRYYSLGRRIVGLDHTKVYGPRPLDTVSWGLRLLGIATLIQCLLRTWQCSTTQDTTITSISNIKCISHNSTTQDTTITSISNIKCISHSCQLCLEATATTATLCGHLFCWTLFNEWLRVKP